jgi:hypothetical protein
METVSEHLYNAISAEDDCETIIELIQKPETIL